MMAIHQIYIQGRNINSFYNKMNHKTFFKLFFYTIFSVIDLFIKQTGDVISSKNNQASENQVKDVLYTHKNQQPDDVIASKYNQASDNQV